MSVEVLTRAPSLDLTDLATVKSRLGSPDGDDALVRTLVTSASHLIAAAVGRDEIVLQQYREVADSRRRKLLLSRFPIDPDRVTVAIDGEAVTDFRVLDAPEGILWRESWWPSSPLWIDGVPRLEVTYWAGWVPPTRVTDWSSTLTPSIGDWARPTDLSSTPLLFEATSVAGAVGADEPIWTKNAGEVVADGGVIWTGRRVPELPVVLGDYTYLTVSKLYAERPDGLLGQQLQGGLSERYSLQSAEELLPVAARAGIGGFRRAFG